MAEKKCIQMRQTLTSHTYMATPMSQFYNNIEYHSKCEFNQTNFVLLALILE